MNCRCFLPLIALISCLVFPTMGLSQETVFYSDETNWGNPYPGLGNAYPSVVHPDSANHRFFNFSTSPFSSVNRFSAPWEREESTELSPIDNGGGELYLSRLPNNRRTGMFQRITFNTLWAPDSGDRGLGMTEVDLGAMFALPFCTRESPLLITPSFTSTIFDSDFGFSETFYRTGLNVRWVRPIVKNKFTADIGVGVLYSGDFKATGSDTIRVPIHVAGIWDFNPRTKLIFGVAYLDRKDSFNFFPMAGLIWTPHDDLSVELVVPRMRIAQRIRWFGSAAGEEQSDWIYGAFEFGGGSWGYEFYGRQNTRFEYRDLRFLVGYERRTRIGLTLGLEVGVMFDREAEIEYHSLKFSPSESVFLRLRTSF